jgi:hypothetical protein
MAKSEGPARNRAAIVAAVISAVMAVAKLTVGHFSGSVAVVASGVDSLLDVLASGLNAWAIRHAAEPPDDDHHFGHGKAESLAALAQAGYESDPRLRGAARRMVDRVLPFLKSPLAQKPWIRLGNQHVLPADVTAPSFHLLVMLGYMPHFRSEHYEFMDRLFSYLTQPWPRQQPVQQVGPHLIEQPHLVLGDLLPTRHAMDADMASSLGWLEVMARIGYLKKHDGWCKLLDRLLDDRDRKHVWTPPRSVVMPERVPVWSWPLLPLSDPTFGESADAAFSADVTFRLALIAQLCGREIALA